MTTQEKNDKLIEGLRKIAGGCFTRASTLAVKGDWKGLLELSQAEARDLIAEYGDNGE